MARPTLEVLLAILGMCSLSGCLNRTFVVFPELAVRVTDRSGVGLAGASLTFYVWSNPHSRLDAEASYAGDAQGHLSTPEEVSSETVAPFLPHGVAEHHWTFCVSVPGYRTLVGSLEDLVPGTTVRFTLPLTPGESRDVCSDFTRVRLGSGESRDDITAQNALLSGVYEVAE